MADNMFKLKIDPNIVVFSFYSKSIFNGNRLIGTMRKTPQNML